MLKAPGHSLLPPKRYLFPFRVPPTPRSNTHEKSIRCRLVVDDSNDDDDARLGQQCHTARCTLGNNTTPLGTRSATTMPRLGDDANLGDNATPLSARLVTTTPSLETLGDNTKPGSNSTLGKDATLADDAMPLTNSSKNASTNTNTCRANWCRGYGNTQQDQ